MPRWKPGESGNPSGRPHRRVFDERLRQALTAQRSAKSRELIQALLTKASTGNVAALKLVAERVGGKPKPAEVTHEGKEAKTLGEVQQQLAKLLSNPAVKRLLEKAMFTEPEKEAVQ